MYDDNDYINDNFITDFYDNYVIMHNDPNINGRIMLIFTAYDRHFITITKSIQSATNKSDDILKAVSH